ncbi:MAG: hypothetical protein U9Q80_02895 [Bacillota bacterium]|nr:hypothetical protein [Bacillota bacterium]
MKEFVFRSVYEVLILIRESHGKGGVIYEKVNKSGIILILALIALICGCSHNSTTQEASGPIDPILEAALDMTFADYSLSTLRISGSEYISITEEYLIDSDTWYSEPFFGFEGTEYTVFDIKEMTENEYAAFKKSIKKTAEELEYQNFEEIDTAWTSNVIDDVEFSFKYVFARIETKLNKKDAYYFKKYTFSKVDDQWKILVINSYLDYIDTPRDERSMNKYLFYDNLEIKYINEVQLNE